jgi:hypothetical protein
VETKILDRVSRAHTRQRDLNTVLWKTKKKQQTACEFANEDEEMKIQIIHKTRDQRLRKKALRETMDLKASLAHGTSLEITDQQAQRCHPPLRLNFSATW